MPVLMAALRWLMGSVLVWLVENIGWLAKKVLITLGIGAVSYAAFSALAQSVVSLVVGYYGELPGDVAQFLGLGGIPQAIGIILSAFVARAGLMAASKLELLAK